MRNLCRVGLILALVVIFVVTFAFVTANTQPVTLDLLASGWQWQITLGVLVVVSLALGLLIGLCAGLGLKGLGGLLGSRS